MQNNSVSGFLSSFLIGPDKRKKRRRKKKEKRKIIVPN